MPELQKKYPIVQIEYLVPMQGMRQLKKVIFDIAVEITGPMGLNFVAMADEIEDLFGKKPM